MTQPLPYAAVSGRQEPFCRQCHNEYSSSTDRSTDYYHPIRRKFLRQRADNRHQANDNDRVNGGKLAHRRVHAEFANAELRKNVIHLQKDRFQKSDEEEENKQSIEAGLTDQPPEKMCGVDRALPHGLSNAFPKTRRSPVIARRFFDHAASIVRFCSSANEINHGKQHDLECEADHEQLLV